MKSLLRINPALARFTAVGALGFVVDCGLFTFLLALGWNVFLVRAISFVAAVTATWLCNRRWTFSASRFSALREWGMYASGQLLGGFLSLGVYLALVAWWPALRQMTIVPYGFGAAVALAFNFTVASRLVFRPPARRGRP